MHEIRAIIKFLVFKGLKNKEITHEINSVYGLDTVAHPTVKKWAKRFREGRTSIEDDERSGRPPPLGPMRTDSRAAKIVSVHILPKDLYQAQD
jgi:transposase